MVSLWASIIYLSCTQDLASLSDCGQIGIVLMAIHFGMRSPSEHIYVGWPTEYIRITHKRSLCALAKQQSRISETTRNRSHPKRRRNAAAAAAHIQHIHCSGNSIRITWINYKITCCLHNWQGARSPMMVFQLYGRRCRHLYTIAQMLFAFRHRTAFHNISLAPRYISSQNI